MDYLNKFRQTTEQTVTIQQEKTCSTADSEHSGVSEYSLSSCKINGLDINTGLEKYNLNEEIYLKILNSYTVNTRNILDAVSAIGIVNESNIEKYKLRVHSIKGTSLDICADSVGKRAAQLENAAKTGDIGYINDNTSDFLKDAYVLLDEIDTLLAKIKNLHPRPVKDKPDKELLIKLRDACNEYSMDGVDAAMEQIEKYDYTEDDGIVVWLRNKVNVVAFSQIAERLNNY